MIEDLFYEIIDVRKEFEGSLKEYRLLNNKY